MLLLPLLALFALAAPPPQLVAVRQPTPAVVQLFQTMPLPGSTLTWGEIHARAWAGALSPTDIAALQAVKAPPEGMMALRYLLTNAEACGDAASARRSVDAMLATEGFRNNAELLAIDARLRANAGDHAGAAAAAAKARLRLDTLDAEVKDVALAHILCVEAVLAQAALDVNPERKTRAVAAWRAVAAHATATGHPELQPLARAGLASIQTR